MNDYPELSTTMQYFSSRVEDLVDLSKVITHLSNDFSSNKINRMRANTHTKLKQSAYERFQEKRLRFDLSVLIAKIFWHPQATQYSIQFDGETQNLIEKTLELQNHILLHNVYHLIFKSGYDYKAVFMITQELLRMHHVPNDFHCRNLTAEEMVAHSIKENAIYESQLAELNMHY